MPTKTVEKIIDTTLGKHLSIIINYGRWEFREEVPVPQNYQIDKNSEQYKLCKNRLIYSIRKKIPHYAD